MGTFFYISVLLAILIIVAIVPVNILEFLQKEFKRWSASSEIGGYVHDTHMCQYIPPTAFHPAGATWTWVAGQVANTIALHRAAASATVIFTIPVMIPSNASPLKGAYLKSVEIDYEITAGAATGLTFLIHKVTRAVEGAAIGAPAAQAFTQSPTVAIADDVDEHRMVLTLTTPIWIDNDEYVLVQGTLVAGASAVLDLYSAVANFTLRL